MDDVPVLLGACWVSVVMSVIVSSLTQLLDEDEALVKTKSKTEMNTPTTKLTRKTRNVRFASAARVGQVTFFSSDHDSSMKRRIRCNT